MCRFSLHTNSNAALTLTILPEKNKKLMEQTLMLLSPSTHQKVMCMYVCV